MENKKFAWCPVKVTSGRRIWLSTYYEHVYLYDPNTGRPPLTSLYFRWTETPSEKTWRLLTDGIVHNRNIWNEHKLSKEDKI